MKNFIQKLSLFLSPFILAFLLYFVLDPFKIIYNYGDDLFVENGIIDGFALNRDYVGTELFLNKRKTHNYDSFIFGSSRSSAFLDKDWRPLIKSTNPTFHFTGSGEKLFGIWKKFLLLKELNHPIKHALIPLDPSILSGTKDGNSVLTIRHPSTSKRFINFHLLHIKEFISTDFFIQFLDFKLFQKQRAYMDKLFADEKYGYRYDTITNDWIFEGMNKELKENESEYYKKNSNMFFERSKDHRYAKSVIEKEQLEMLEDIVEILQEKKSNYKVIINPTYNQLAIDSSDFKKLENIFDKDNVYNFSGVNNITNDIKNYYEFSHFRPKVGKYILNEIYNQ